MSRREPTVTMAHAMAPEATLIRRSELLINAQFVHVAVVSDIAHGAGSVPAKAYDARAERHSIPDADAHVAVDRSLDEVISIPTGPEFMHPGHTTSLAPWEVTVEGLRKGYAPANARAPRQAHSDRTR